MAQQVADGGSGSGGGTRHIDAGGIRRTDSGGTRHIDAEGIREIVRTRVRPAYDAVADAMKIFETTPDGAAGFGGFDAGTDLARLHAATKSVFTSTVQGVGEDLDTFGHNLQQGAKAWENADESSADRARRLVEKLVPSTTSKLSSVTKYDQSRRTAGEKLDLTDNLQHEEKETDEVTGSDGTATPRTESSGASTGSTGSTGGDVATQRGGATHGESG